MGVGNLAHFMHKITLFHQQHGAAGLKPEQGAEPPWPPHFNHCDSAIAFAIHTLQTAAVTSKCSLNAHSLFQKLLIMC